MILGGQCYRGMLRDMLSEQRGERVGEDPSRVNAPGDPRGFGPE